MTFRGVRPAPFKRARLTEEQAHESLRSYLADRGAFDHTRALQNGGAAIVDLERAREERRRRAHQERAAAHANASAAELAENQRLRDEIARLREEMGLPPEEDPLADVDLDADDEAAALDAEDEADVAEAEIADLQEQLRGTRGKLQRENIVERILGLQNVAAAARAASVRAQAEEPTEELLEARRSAPTAKQRQRAAEQVADHVLRQRYGGGRKAGEPRPRSKRETIRRAPLAEARAREAEELTLDERLRSKDRRVREAAGIEVLRERLRAQREARA